MARKTPGLNTSSMADISFLLLAFFLMVSDIKTDKGIARVLPPIPKENAEKPEIHQRNIFTVLVNSEDRILTTTATGGLEPCSIDQLKGRVKTFLNSNRGENPMLPELEPTDQLTATGTLLFFDRTDTLAVGSASLIGRMKI